ncbi:phospholipase, patatin family [Paenibacillus larvae subsp. larvae DSM 25430]|uniref:Phospholipase, patatin family n=2 Tax=Paenibacillus larvae TaxID=1464 RepID=V9W659_9BACL|nr:phospholipase, patatin family [Paenibacillus larvae subsp. larvae DSM 25430]AVG11967.1 phospholipase, patatin family [Paenibacillus larvae subsp. larvae DSM 25430]
MAYFLGSNAAEAITFAIFNRMAGVGEMESVGLVLEGGGMRGIYTAGVLEFFIENDFYTPYVIGVSAGACNATSYIARQMGRNRKVTVDYVRDPRYLSYRNLWREKSIFGMNFIFNKLPNELEPFDFESFYSSEQNFVVGTTDAHTGEPVFFSKKETGEQTLQIVQASSSLPFLSQPVKYGGRVLFDGGVSAPIPILQSEKDGNKKHVVVLTRPAGYRKKPAKGRWLAKRFYPEYSGLVQALANRARVYNETLEYIQEQEDKGNVFVFRPSVPVHVGRTEKDPRKLSALFEVGYKDAKRQFGALKEWVRS